MLFNSSEFLIFFTLVFALFAVMPKQWRLHWILISSYFFYGFWEPAYALILLGSTGLDFFLAIHLISEGSRLKRRLGLGLSIAINLSVLIAFKYLNFFGELVFSLSGNGQSYEPLSILLPIGISFYTFQTIGYSVDVYRRQVHPETNFFRFALYTSFFPQLIAGPIERAKDLLPQLSRDHFSVDFNNLKVALWYFTIGLFMKVVLADNSGIVVDAVFGDVMSNSDEKLTYSAVLFTVQIYSDFGGYSLMAIGLARCFNISLSENFTYPFFAQSLTMFWRSWHRTLSHWFRDYLYIPLGGNQKTRFKTYLNLVIVFVVVGFWHGAAWNFVLWGALNGLVLIIERLFGIREKSTGVIGLFRTIFTFMLTIFLFVSFRLKSMDEIVRVWTAMISVDPTEFAILLYDNRFSIPVLGGIILFGMEVYLKPRPVSVLTKMFWVNKLVLFALFFFAILMMGNFSGGQFIYFQF